MFLRCKQSTLNKTFHIQVCVFFYSIIINFSIHALIFKVWCESNINLLIILTLIYFTDILLWMFLNG